VAVWSAGWNESLIPTSRPDSHPAGWDESQPAGWDESHPTGWNEYHPFGWDETHPNQPTRQPHIQSEKYQCRINTVNSPDDGHIVARNM